MYAAASGDFFDFESTWRAVQPEDIVTLIYTSGTTGNPKGVEMTHANLLFEGYAIDEVLGIRFGDRVTSFLPSAHIADRMTGLYLQEMFGTQVTAVADARTIAAALPDVRPTVWGAVPRVWEKLKAGIEFTVARETDEMKRQALAWAMSVAGKRANALLAGESRSLSISEVLATVRPLASYIAARNWAVAGAADLTNRSTIRWTLHQMVASGVVSVYDAGTEAVWGIGEDQHLVAAFYRNTAIHILVDRAVAELALLAAAETTTNGSVSPATVRDEALSLRDLLKFEFLFSGRAQFEKDLANEVLLIGSVVDTSKPAAAADVWRLLESADVLLAHLVLRPFLDAYHIVADRLAAHEDDSFDEEGFLAECLQVGKQWELQRNIASAESRSMELFKTALRLARHRELVDGADATDIAKRRQQFADEIATATRRVNTIAELARRQ